MLPENENDDLGKENKPATNGKPATKTRTRVPKQKTLKPVIFFEDSSTAKQREKLPARSSGVTQKSARTLRNKTTQKDTSSRHKASEHESLPRIDSPGNYSQLHEVSVNRKQENAGVKNIKALTPNVIVDKETNSTYLGLQGLDVSVNGITTEVSEITEALPASEQVGQLNGKTVPTQHSCNTHAPVPKAPRSLRTYSRLNSKAMLQEKSQTSQKNVNKGAVVNRPKDDDSMHKKTVKTYGKQACSSGKGIKKISTDSTQAARKTRVGGKSDGIHASTSSPYKSSEKENSNEALITHMENLVFESKKDKCSDASGVEKVSTRGSQFLFTPSGKTVRKERDETIAASSSPEELHICARQTNKHSKINKDKKCKVIPSSASEDETPPDLKLDTGNEEAAATLKGTKPKKGVRSSKRRQVPLRHHFILN